MQITKSKLKQLIKEEMQTLSEWEVDPEEEDRQEYDGLYSQIDAWTKELLERGNIDEMRELNGFLEKLLNKLDDPYRR
jgi:soluble cytochrome b562